MARILGAHKIAPLNQHFSNFSFLLDLQISPSIFDIHYFFYLTKSTDII